MYEVFIKTQHQLFSRIILSRPILAPTIAPVTESTTPIPSIIHTINDPVQIGIPQKIELTISALHKNGVYQTLFGYALQIAKHAMVKIITKATDTPNRYSVDFGLFPVSSWIKKPRYTIVMKIVNKDHPRALSQAKRNFLVFSFIVECLNF